MSTPSLQTSCPVTPAREESRSSACPLNLGLEDAPAPSVRPEEELVLPRHRRVVASYGRNAQGGIEYSLRYGVKEVSFDEPELFGFGEALALQTRFLAGAAQGWGPGYAWETVQPLLDGLLVEGILERAQNGSEVRREGVVAARLAAGPANAPRSWRECEALSLEFSGRAVELGYLELFVPVYRILHPVLDRDQRQVGEANVFPEALRLTVPTEWRACQYPGSRYQDECPMNVTALRAMIKHWKPMMAVLQHIRAAYLERCPEAKEEFTLGHLERLSALVLVLPTYLFMREPAGIKNGELHPMLSSLFRVTDGLRLTAHQMLLEGLDGLGRRDPSLVVSSADIFDYAERTAGFLSAHGVCSGPRHMIDEFLQVVIEGKCVAGLDCLDAEGREALDELPAAFEYGWRALQSFCVTMSFWARLATCYQRALSLVLEAGPDPGDAVQPLARLLARRVRELGRTTALIDEESRQTHARLYRDTYAEAARALGDAMPTLVERLAPSSRPGDIEAKRLLGAALCARLAPGSEPSRTNCSSLRARSGLCSRRAPSCKAPSIGGWDVPRRAARWRPWILTYTPGCTRPRGPSRSCVTISSRCSGCAWRSASDRSRSSGSDAEWRSRSAQ
jgi:hypothetical protein